MEFALDTLLCTLFEFGNLWTLEIRHLPPSNPKRNSIMYKWYKEELYRIVISTLIMTDRRNCDINLELCTSNKWSSQIYVYNKTTKKVFLNTLITPKKKIILKVSYNFFEIMPLIIYTVLTIKKV